MATNQLLDLVVPTQGMNTDNAAHTIDDEQAVLLQDLWVWKPGRLIARGNLDVAPGTNFQSFSTSGKAHGMFGVRFPNTDKERIIAVTNTTSDGNIQFNIYEPDTNTRTNLPMASITGGYARPFLMNVSPSIRGGVYIGFAQHANEGVSNQLGFFYTGSKKADYNSNGWNTWNIGASSPSVLTRAGGGLTAAAEAGMAVYVFDGTNMKFAGIIKSVDSDTQITLDSPVLAAYANGTSYYVYLYNKIPFHYEIAKGQATVATGSTSVLGLGTRFRAMGVVANDRLYRRKDNAFIGLVNTITDDETLTLVSGATTSLVEEDYFILKQIDNNQISIGIDFAAQQAPGWLSAAYAGRQWYANRGSGQDISGKFVNRLWWSEVDNAFSVDFSIDGDHLHVESERAVDEPIVGLRTVENGLLIFKYSETYLLTGTTPDDFQVTKILDDGCLGLGSIQSYHNGVIWAGRDGIYHWTGSTVNNLIEDRLTQKWKSHTQNFDTAADRVYGTAYNDHYIVWFDKATGNELNFGNNVRGASTTTPKHSLAIYIPNKASTVLTNIYPRGYYIPGNPSLVPRFITSISGTHYICSLPLLWKEQDAVDVTFTDGASVGPDCYVQTKQYDAQTPSIKKIWKTLLMNYRAFGQPILIDTIIGLNDSGVSTSANFPANVIFQTKRIKFMRRSQFLGFRMYISTLATPRIFYLNRLALLFRPQRLGRP